jgi:NADH-quinone oxidoreductase subunit L
MCIGIGVAVLGIFLAFVLYKNADKDPLPAKLGALATWMRDKFYFDELYEATVIRAHDIIAAIFGFIDRWILEGAIIGLIRGGTDLTGRSLRRLQTGSLQTYAFLFVFGVAVLLYFVLVK